MPGWLLCDYGEVLSSAPPADEWGALQDTAGFDDSAEFHRLYWTNRPAYDHGDLSAEEYWALVGASPGRLPDLVARDVAIWLHAAPGAAEAAIAAAEAAGLRLALLSNAPVEVAEGIDRLEWLRPWEQRFFSCRLRAVKPELAAYEKVLKELSATPGEVWFFDDREANVAAATSIGIKAVHFTKPEDFLRVREG
jgi:putative hydrolase of the HAD superfamily